MRPTDKNCKRGKWLYLYEAQMEK